MGGIGKTTLAKSVYNKLLHSFEATCFLANVRELSEPTNGLVYLQEQLLFDLLKLDQKIELRSIHSGMTVLKERLHSRRVLIVVDDVSDANQLKVLTGEASWFGPGSRIIVTTRNEDSLKEINKVDRQIYVVEELNYDESLYLFNLHAFYSGQPKEDFLDLSKEVVTYCQGLPLALEVLGSFMLDLSIGEWKSALKKLKKMPPDEVQKQLQLSYEALDDNEREIFLHIAFFFRRCTKNPVITILDGCGLCGEIGITRLIKRCLLKMEGNRLIMHDMIWAMGVEIVRREYPRNPGNCSRLRSCGVTMSTLKYHLGTENVQGLQLYLRREEKLQREEELDAASFAGMSRLKLLMLMNVRFNGNVQIPSRDLRYLLWENYPLSFIPDVYMGNLVALSMKRSKLESPWKAMQFLGKLKLLNLSHSSLLTETPDLSRIPNLESLILEGCIKLKHIHVTIGQLRHLVEVNLKDCKELGSIPSSICMLKSLEILNICGCSKVIALPGNIGEIESLTNLLANGTSITQLPACTSTGWKNLRELSLCEVSCNLSDDFMPTKLSCSSLHSLEILHLSRNKFSRLPGMISCIPNLLELRLDSCTNLVSLSNLPPSLRILDASCCTALERISLLNGAFKFGGELYLRHCSKLEEILGLHMWNLNGSYVRRLGLEGCNNLSYRFKERLIKKDWTIQGTVSIPGGNIPEWVDYKSSGASLSFLLPRCRDCEVQRLTLCFTYAPILESDNLSVSATFHSKTTNSTCEIKVGKLSAYGTFLFEDQMVIVSVGGYNDIKGFLDLSPNSGLLKDIAAEVGVTVEPTHGRMTVKSVGVHLHGQVCKGCRQAPPPNSKFRGGNCPPWTLLKASIPAPILEQPLKKNLLWWNDLVEAIDLRSCLTLRGSHNKCSFCYTNETLEHALFFCPWTRPVLFGAMGVHLPRKQVSLVAKWIQEVILPLKQGRSDGEMVWSLFGFVMRNIWKERCRAVSERSKPNPQTVVVDATKVHSEFWALKDKFKIRNKFSRQKSLLQTQTNYFLGQDFSLDVAETEVFFPLDDELDVTESEDYFSLDELDVTKTEEYFSLDELDVIESEEYFSLDELDVTETKEYLSLDELDVTESEHYFSLDELDVTKSEDYFSLDELDVTETEELSPLDELDVGEIKEFSHLDELDFTETEELCPLDELDVGEIEEFSPLDELDVTETEELSLLDELDVGESEDYFSLDELDVTETEEYLSLDELDVTESEDYFSLDELDVMKTEELSPLDELDVGEIEEFSSLDEFPLFIKWSLIVGITLLGIIWVLLMADLRRVVYENVWNRFRPSVLLVKLASYMRPGSDCGSEIV